MARSVEWRERYAISKLVHAPLFKEEIIEWSPLRIDFVGWLEFYHGIYSMPEGERPFEDIINDDELLEVWFENKKAQRRQEEMSQRLNSGSSEKQGGKKDSFGKGMKIISAN